MYVLRKTEPFLKHAQKLWQYKAMYLAYFFTQILMMKIPSRNTWFTWFQIYVPIFINPLITWLNYTVQEKVTSAHTEEEQKNE